MFYFILQRLFMLADEPVFLVITHIYFMCKRTTAK